MRSAVYIIMLLPVFAFAQKITVDEYIEKYSALAMEEMNLSKIPASITLAQGILESGFGNSELAKRAKNHFGIKCHTGWKGKGYYMDDDSSNECFRVYKTDEQSYRDHSQFLTGRSRYSSLFQLPIDDYKGWAKGLKKAGYATNPKYPSILIGIIERYNLSRFDHLGYQQKEMLAEVKPIKKVVIEERIVREPINNVEKQKHTDIDAKYETTYVNAKGKEDYFPRSNQLIFSHNGIKTIRVGKGESLRLLAKRFQIPITRLCDYNDMQANSKVKEGSMIYLSPKKNKTYQNTHLIQEGEDLLFVSQAYGIKLSKLRDRNMLVNGQEPAINEILYLNRKASHKPKIAPYVTQKNKIESEESAIEIAVKPVIVDKEAVVVESKVETSADLQPFRVEKRIVIHEETTDENVIVETTNYEAEIETGSVDDATGILMINEPTKLSSMKKHLVTKGQTLYALSKMYNTDIDTLKRVNNLSDNNIREGQIIVIQ